MKTPTTIIKEVMSLQDWKLGLLWRQFQKTLGSIPRGHKLYTVDPLATDVEHFTKGSVYRSRKYPGAPPWTFYIEGQSPEPRPHYATKEEALISMLAEAAHGPGTQAHKACFKLLNLEGWKTF